MIQKSNEVLYSKGKNNECYSPSYVVTPLLPYIPKGKIVWCPFDTKDSEFVKLISKQNEVVYSHIDTGQDYYYYEPDKWDIMISNPPFEKKRQIFERALSFNKPFALLMTVTWFNDNAPIKLFMEKDLELMFFDKRVEYYVNGIQNRPTFASAYYCYNFLPKQIIMKSLDMSNNHLFEF